MKHKKSSKTQIKILTDEFTSILKPHSKYPQYQPAKTKPHHLSKHTKTNSTKINLVSTDVFKNLPKHSSSKSTEHNLLDQTKNSSDTATTVSKRYTNTNSNNKLNILKTNAHRDYMENFLKTVNKSINKNKSFILTNKTSNAHNITLMSGNVFANKKKFNVTNTNTNNGGYCNSSSNKKKKKNVVSTCSGKTSSNGVVEGNSNSNSNKYSNEVYTSCNKNGCNVQYKYNISNNVMDYHSSSLISEESVFSSNKHSITNTHNSSSLKYLTQVSNKYSSNNNSISNEQDYVSYTYSDDEVSCRSKFTIMYLYCYIYRIFQE